MNDLIVGTICQVVDNALSQEMENLTMAYEAWNKLKGKMYRSDVISKFNALHTAMRTCFTTPNTVTATIANIKDLIEIIYDRTAPTKEEMLITLYLYAMADDEFDWLCKLMIGNMTLTSLTITPDEITCRLEMEAQEARHCDSTKEGKKLLMVQQKKQQSHKPSMKCTHCQRSGDTVEKCWEEGGGSAGQAPDWWKSIKDKKDGWKGSKKKKDQAHAAITSDSSDSRSESCALLHEPLICFLDWKNILASTADVTAAAFIPPYLLDSGATSHCSPYHEDFSDLKKIPTCQIRGINGSAVTAIGMGTIHIKCGKGRQLTLKDALYILDVKLWLISIGHLSNGGLQTSFTATTCTIQPGSKVITGGICHGKGLYTLTEQVSVEHIHIAPTTAGINTWHRRLGHVHYAAIIRMAEKQLAKGMPTNLSYLPQVCEHCVLAKQAQTPIPKLREGVRAKRVLEKVFSDITGPGDVQTPHSKLYILNLIDDYLQKAWIFTLKRKSEACEYFKEWKAQVEQETNQKVHILRTDNGGEYSSKDFESYLRKQGISHQVTAPYSSAQNGKAERLDHTFFNRAHTIMSENKFPPKLWGECVHTAAYLRDCTPTHTLKNMTPYEAYYGSRPDISHLHKIGCHAFILVTSKHHPKIYDRSIEGVLVGYSSNSKAYRRYYPKTGRIIVPQHVSFIELKDNHHVHFNLE